MTEFAKKEQDVYRACNTARDYDDLGEFDAACRQLSQWWQIGREPDASGLSNHGIATLLLRAGALTITAANRAKSAETRRTLNNHAQQLLIQSRMLFALDNNISGQIEAYLDLGFSYYWANDFISAADSYENARELLAKNLSSYQSLYIVCAIRLSALKRVGGKFTESFEVLKAAQPFLLDQLSNTLQGRFYNELATTLKNQLPKSHGNDWDQNILEAFEQAHACFARVGNRRFTAITYNNLGLYHVGKQRLTQAQHCFEAARAIVVTLDDVTRVAQVDESRAQAALAQEEYAEAEQLAESAAKVFRSQEEYSLLAEALSTLGAARVGRNQTELARDAFEEATQVAISCGDWRGSAQAALAMLESFGEKLSPDTRRRTLARAEQSVRAGQLGSEFNDRLANALAKTEEWEEADRRAQEQAVLQEKMAALGSLAFGVAHDFNNTLTVVMGRMQILQHLKLGERIMHHVDVAAQAAREASQMISHMQDFGRGRGQRERFTQVDGRAILLEVQTWAQTKALKKKIVIEVGNIFTQTPLAFWGDPPEVKEALLNVVYNAVDATPEGGTITLDCERRGQMTVFTLRDEGGGIPPEIKTRIFEPFFSTKGEKGNGMGLAMVYSIVQRHGGSIDFDSTPGVGTTFHIAFPSSDMDEEQMRATIERDWHDLPITPRQPTESLDNEILH